MEHAIVCEECLCWTTYALAAQEALLTTGRIFKDQNCPVRPLLYAIILAAVKCADIGQKINRNIHCLSDALEIELLGWVVNHLNSDSLEYCRFCRDYYDKVFDEVERLK